MDKKEIEFLDRINVQKFLADNWDFLQRERSYYMGVQQKAPGDIVAMGAIKRIENDLQIIEPLVKEVQKANLEDLEVMTGKTFAYLLQNKVKDRLKKAN